MNCWRKGRCVRRAGLGGRSLPGRAVQYGPGWEGDAAKAWVPGFWNALQLKVYYSIKGGNDKEIVIKITSIGRDNTGIRKKSPEFYPVLAGSLDIFSQNPYNKGA